MIEEFYRNNFDKQVKKIRYIIGSHSSAEDVVQEAYRRAVKYQSSYREEMGELSTWFNSILYNSMKDWQTQDRDKGIVKKPLSDDIVEELTYIVENEHIGFIEKEIEGVLGDGRVQSVLYLWFILGYSAKEISQVVNSMSVTNVTTIATRFRKLIQKKHDVSI
ncbi:MAG: sigma-70 family RNA polymerase sigma factor [Crocinitomix sp.]|nr:sigma-70 family RNA polymerase sigma factor [Crocinitomix sp.]